MTLSDRVLDRLRRVAVADTPAFPPGEGDLIGERFELLELIGSGASGVVFRASDLETGREVALKAVAWKEAWDDGRFAREAAALASLEHPAIVRYIAHGELGDGAGYLVTELLEGRTLAARLRDGEPSIAETLTLALRLADALGEVHERGLVHRDIKPSNIFLCGGDLSDARIIDFGIARREGAEELTRTGAILGTPGYLAPEQARSQEEVGPATDVFALGCVLYRCLTGKSPFEGGDVLSVALRTVLDHPPPVSSLRASVSEVLDELVEKMLAKDPAERPRSGDDLVHEIERAARAQKNPTIRPAPPVRPKARPPFAKLAIVAAAGLGAAALLVASISGKDAPTQPPVDPAPTVDPMSQPIVAILPFVDETKEDRLDFSPAGLAYLVGSELRTVPGLATVGYYRLAKDVSSPDTPGAWIEAARAAGATMVVTGRLTRSAEGIETVLTLSKLDGEVVTSATRTSDVEGVPEAVRSGVADLARALGSVPEPRERRKTALSVERSIQLAVAEIEQYRLDRARPHLEAALLADPSSAEAHYWLALVSWWEHDEPSALRSIEIAHGAGLDEARQGFLNGLKSFIAREHRSAMTELERLAAKYPDDRDILYGLSEACFHGGDPARGAEIYRKLVAAWPRFRLGMFHVFDHYRLRGDAAGLAWVLERRDADRPWWEARAKVALRDYDGALRLLHTTVELPPTDGVSRLDVEREIVATDALAGQLSLAATLAEELRGRHHSHGAAALHGLATLRGVRAEQRKWAEQLVRDARSRSPSEERFEVIAPVALMTVLRGAESPELENEIVDAVRGSFLEGGPRSGALLVTMAGFRGDTAGLERWRLSGPLAEAAARAVEAELARNAEEAAARWTKAADLATWGEATITFRFLAARAQRTNKRDAEVVIACDEVIRPRMFSWVWAEAVGPCLLWTAQSQRGLGETEAANAALDRLLLLRADTPDDPLAAAARRDQKR